MLKGKLICFAEAKDEELRSPKAGMFSFKNEHEEKIQNTENSIVKYTMKKLCIVIRIKEYVQRENIRTKKKFFGL